MKMKNYFGVMLLAIFSLSIVSAGLQVDNLYFDPAIVTAGDTVEVVVQYSVDSSGTNNDRLANEDYSFGVELVSDDSVTEKYVTITDAEGDFIGGEVLAGNKYTKVFRLKLADNAPVGDYQFKIIGQWYFNDRPVDSYQSKKFFMPVKKQGIVLGVASVSTVPVEVRPGDDYVTINANIENSGERHAKSVEFTLDLPEGFSASYSDNNRFWAGQILAGSYNPAKFSVDVSDELVAGIYNFTYNFKYEDSDNNEYVGSQVVPFYLKSKPNIEVVNVEGLGKKGSSGKVYVTLKNTGDESAEAVDVRILKQSSQPFDFDVRSDYVGELMPGEEGVAIFNLEVQRSAEEKEYDLKLLIRVKGDSDSGDDNIYTFNERAKFEVVGSFGNVLLFGGLIGFVIIIGIFVKKKGFKSFWGGKKK